MKANPIVRLTALVLTLAVPALGAEVDRREAKIQMRSTAIEPQTGVI
jgi:hypothetical protein